MGCHFLLHGIFQTQESKPGLLHCRQILYRLSYKGSPRSMGGLFILAGERPPGVEITHMIASSVGLRKQSVLLAWGNMNMPYPLPPSGHSTESYNDSPARPLQGQSSGSMVTFSCIQSLKHRTVWVAKLELQRDRVYRWSLVSASLFLNTYTSVLLWLVCLSIFLLNSEFLEDNNPVIPVFDLVLSRPVGPSVNVCGPLGWWTWSLGNKY